MANPPYDGTKSLPSDNGINSANAPASARFLAAVWDTINGVFWAPRGTTQGNTIVQVEKGAPVATQVNVTASVLLLAANTLRKKATFYNNGTQTVYLSQTSPALTATGYAVPAGAEFSDDTGQAAWYAIAASGTQNMCVMEYS